jgi:hypothetical protein
MEALLERPAQASPSSIAIVDQSMKGDVSFIMQMIFSEEMVLLREVIARRVRGEVAAYNAKAQAYRGQFAGLVSPNPAEAQLNGVKTTRPVKQIDAQAQVDVALAAFSRNRYFVLVDDVQCEGLDDEIVVAKTTQISFLKLTALVGG